MDRMKLVAYGLLTTALTILAMAAGCTRQVIREVPVDRVVERVVIREVPVDVVVERQVIKEVPLEKAVFSEMPLTVSTADEGPATKGAEVVLLGEGLVAGTQPQLEPKQTDTPASLQPASIVFPGIPHAVDFSSACPLCHRPSSEIHANLAGLGCTTCHKAVQHEPIDGPSPVPVQSPTPATGDSPERIPHNASQSTDCLACHQPSSVTHVGLPGNTCTLCHATTAGGPVSPASGPAVARISVPSGGIAHPTEGNLECYHCHLGFESPRAMAHSGDPPADCSSCHQPASPVHGTATAGNCPVCHEPKIE